MRGAGSLQENETGGIRIVNAFADILMRVERGESPVLRIEAAGEQYLRRFDGEERLILLGGGHVAKALADMAAMLSFCVTVVDDRADFVTEERFPAACARLCDEFTDAIRKLNIRKSDYVCILTRGHKWDRECLCTLLNGTEPSYLGMIGSRRRVAGMMSALSELGYDPNALARVHAPIGLAIGAVTPAEIAVSICAELIAHRRSQKREEAMPQSNTDRSMLQFLAAEHGPRAYVLVLDSNGSAPVKAGAMMAVDGAGGLDGTIGGGPCARAARYGERLCSLVRYDERCRGRGRTGLRRDDARADP